MQLCIIQFQDVFECSKIDAFRIKTKFISVGREYSSPSLNHILRLSSIFRPMSTSECEQLQHVKNAQKNTKTPARKREDFAYFFKQDLMRGLSFTISTFFSLNYASHYKNQKIQGLETFFSITRLRETVSII